MRHTYWQKTAAAVLLGGLLAACTAGDPPQQTAPPQTGDPAPVTTAAPEATSLLVDSSYRIVRTDFGDTDDPEVQIAISLMRGILAEMDLNVPLATDWFKNETDIPQKEVLVGKVNRPESEKVYASLNPGEWCVRVIGDKIVVAGDTTTALESAADYFMDTFVRGKEEIVVPKELNHVDTSIKTAYPMTLENGVTLTVEQVSTVFQVPKDSYTESYGYPANVRTAHYPSITKLQYNGEKNGTLIGIFCLGDTPAGPNTQSCVMESTDDGATWKMIARPKETIDTSITGISMAHIYELPAQVGDMPAGTLLYSGNSVDYSRKSHIAVWRSYDCGYTWEEYTIIAEGGGTKEGVWEPFMWYEESDGYLYCFYSDDSDPAHDQKLVYKRSKDGVTWSDIGDVCTFPAAKDRPGMFIMTEMGNGTYLMVYEYFGSRSGAVYYKVTDDLTSWNPTDPGKRLQTEGGQYILSGAPSCIWTPAGGENGTLIVSGKHELKGATGSPKLFISFDRGDSWQTIDNFLPYDPNNDVRNTNRIGHSPSFFVGEDPSVIYYMNCTDTPETGRQRIQFARIRITGEAK